MEYLYLYIIGICSFIALIVLAVIGIKILNEMKEASSLIRAKFDVDFMQRFDTLYEYIKRNKKVSIVLDRKGRAMKVINNGSY